MEKTQQPRKVRKVRVVKTSEVDFGRITRGMERFSDSYRRQRRSPHVR